MEKYICEQGVVHCTHAGSLLCSRASCNIGKFTIGNHFK